MKNIRYTSISKDTSHHLSFIQRIKEEGGGRGKVGEREMINSDTDEIKKNR